jgi:hypothetical protein
MEKTRIRALRHAQLYGYLANRTGRLYYPGGSHPVCSEQTAHEMVRAGWLVCGFRFIPAGFSDVKPATVPI